MAARSKFWKGQHRHAIRRCTNTIPWKVANWAHRLNNCIEPHNGGGGPAGSTSLTM
jgi:hypothetical protein